MNNQSDSYHNNERGQQYGELPVARADELEVAPSEQRWLVRELWTHQAVGLIAGRPKSFKSWLGLDLAVSVASATPCLDRFAVDEPGAALVYLAEDALALVRERIEGICLHRGLDLNSLDLFVITAPSMRLDLAADQARLFATLARLRPKLLVLDPLIRLHRLNEDRSNEVSVLLGFLRELQRNHGVAITVVHHMSKRRRAELGQALRGSSDLHAWTDACVYLTRRSHHDNDRLLLTTEHRCAAAIPPVELKLVSRPDGSATHLEVVGQQGAGPHELPAATAPALSDRILGVLGTTAEPITRAALRAQLRVNNQRLGDALRMLEHRDRVQRTARGWVRSGAGTRPAHHGLATTEQLSLPTPRRQTEKADETRAAQ